jgi:hypothetical protein
VILNGILTGARIPIGAELIFSDSLVLFELLQLAVNKMQII